MFASSTCDGGFSIEFFSVLNRYSMLMSRKRGGQYVLELSRAEQLGFKPQWFAVKPAFQTDLRCIHHIHLVLICCFWFSATPNQTERSIAHTTYVSPHTFSQGPGNVASSLLIWAYPLGFPRPPQSNWRVTSGECILSSTRSRLASVGQ
jgi:hypothetical protein